MSIRRLMLGVAAAAFVTLPAQAAVTVVNNPALFDGTLRVITFDTPGNDTVAEVLANEAVNIHSLDSQAHTFVTGPGFFSGIGGLASNALGSTFNGLISDVSQAPDYSGSSFRSFDIDFGTSVSAFGLTIQGAGLGSHQFELFDGSSNSLGLYSFSAVGLTPFDGGPNGFFGFQVTGAPVAKVRVIQSTVGQDFIAFDNLTFVDASLAVPEPATWALMICGLGLAGAALRRRRVRALSGTRCASTGCAAEFVISPYGPHA